MYIVSKVKYILSNIKTRRFGLNGNEGWVWPERVFGSSGLWWKGTFSWGI